MKSKTVYETYNEFLKMICGYDLDFYDKTGTIIKIENEELCFYNDTSYHGSSSYEKTSSIPLTSDEASILRIMFAMKNTVKKVSIEKQLQELEKEKSFVESNMKVLEDMKKSIK